MPTYSDEVEAINENKIRDILKNDLPDFARKYFSSISNTRSARTRLEYAYDMRAFFDWMQNSAGFRDIDLKTQPASILDRMTIDDFQEYLETLKVRKTASGSSASTSLSTRARKIISLRSFITYYYRIGEIKTDFAVFIEVPKVNETPIVTMDRNEVARYLAAIKNTDGMNSNELLRHEKTYLRDVAIAMTLFGTGIRVSELVGLDRKDLDFYQAKLIVRRKGGDIDEVYFGPLVQAALEDYVNEGRPALAPPPGENALFLSMHHKRLTVSSVQKMVKKYAGRAGIADKKITPHKFRKTFGTNLYEETGDIYLVADALHHSSVETTRKHYAKMSEDHKRIAAKKSETLFEE